MSGIELVITIRKQVIHKLPNLCSFVNEGREYILSFERLQSAHLHNKTVVIPRLTSTCKSGLQYLQNVFCSRANHCSSKTKKSSKVSPGKGRGEDFMHLTQFFSFLCYKRITFSSLGMNKSINNLQVGFFFPNYFRDFAHSQAPPPESDLRHFACLMQQWKRLFQRGRIQHMEHR